MKIQFRIYVFFCGLLLSACDVEKTKETEASNKHSSSRDESQEMLEQNAQEILINDLKHQLQQALTAMDALKAQRISLEQELAAVKKQHQDNPNDQETIFELSQRVEDLEEQLSEQKQLTQVLKIENQSLQAGVNR